MKMSHRLSLQKKHFENNKGLIYQYQNMYKENSFTHLPTYMHTIKLIQILIIFSDWKTSKATSVVWWSKNRKNRAIRNCCINMVCMYE